MCSSNSLCPAAPQSALKDMFGAALVVSAVRLCAIYVGSWVGCYATSTTTEYRRLFWMSMVTQVRCHVVTVVSQLASAGQHVPCLLLLQAGVAMGLARLAGTRFPDWGPAFQTFMVSYRSMCAQQIHRRSHCAHLRLSLCVVLHADVNHPREPADRATPVPLCTHTRGRNQGPGGARNSTHSQRQGAQRWGCHEQHGGTFTARD